MLKHYELLLFLTLESYYLRIKDRYRIGTSSLI